MEKSNFQKSNCTEETNELWKIYKHKNRHKLLFKFFFILIFLSIAMTILVIGTWVVVVY